MPDATDAKPDNTALRTALWRALHVLADPPPHVFRDHCRRARQHALVNPTNRAIDLYRDLLTAAVA